jgi:mannosyl-glycoprotein endo-beta-N-acetylglucosaminidase
MHAAIKSSLVIWYDAITTEGKLEWQDNLTALNCPFFRACDGLFVNYTWKNSTPKRAAAAAG